jgi:hypothetical protein
MNNASIKQKKYLNYILKEKNCKLNTFTNKHIDDLLHNDIVEIFGKLLVPITPFLSNLTYIIKEDFGNYLIGTQSNIKRETQIDLICFKNLLVVDWDIKHGESKQELLENIKESIQKIPYTFYIYETFNGYHGYLISQTFLYSEWKTIELLNKLNCDPFYIGFTRKVGFVIRLNKKKNRNEEFIEKFICKINDYTILPELEKLINIKDNLTCNSK